MPDVGPSSPALAADSVDAASVSAAHRIARWFWALALTTWIQIAFGALVRAEKAGLSCPDWPLCHGKVVPDLKLEGVIYEYGHRVFALAVSGLFAWGGLQVWRHPQLRAKVGRWIIGGAILLVVQIVFGGLTVLIVHSGDGADRPASWTVATHLVLGNTFAALALVAAQELQRWGKPAAIEPAPRIVHWLATLWSSSLLFQLLLGGAIAGSIAGLVCTEFPTCNGGVWFPTFSGWVGWQVIHRLNAYVLTILGFALAWQARKHAALSGVSWALAALIAGQIGVGAANVLTYLDPHMTTAHSLMAALLFSTTGALWYHLKRLPAP